MIQFGRTARAMDGGVRHRIALTGPLAVLALVLMAAVWPAGAHAAACTTTVSSTSAAASAVSSAATGSVVCLADGSYGKLSLNASKSAPGVTVQAANPGAATIAGATMAGSYITLAQFKVQGGSVDVQPASTGMTVDHNLMIGNRTNYAVYVCPGTTTVKCNDVSITNNKIQGSFNEDQIQANLYHDGPDADPYGLLVEGNEFVGNVEWGNHDDVFQSVWGGDNLYFRKNYLHDFGGQGFFVKDQPSAIDGLVFDDNLIVRQNLPCDPTSLCPTWQLAAVQIFGPVKNVSIRHNTVWPGSGGGQSWLRGSGWAGPTVFSDNVFANLNSDASGLTTGYSASNNTYCGGSGMPSTGLTSDCNPAFNDANNSDLRQANGRGVDWRVADQQYGPGAGTTTPPDTTAPDTTIVSAPADPSTSTSASFAFTATESGSTFECKLDAGAYGACTTPKSYGGLATGSHTFSVRATDVAGNTDASAASWTWTISPPSDTTAPDTTISSGPADPSTSTSASFAFTATESGSTFACKLDAGAYTSCTSPRNYVALATGSHTFSVRAIDAAGNADASPATQTWTINPPADTTAPDTTISSGPANPTTSTSATFAFTATEAGSTFQCKLDSAAYAACTSPKAYSGLATGSHTFTVRATDAAGNTDAAPASRTWTINPPVDTTAPDTTITSGPGGPTNDATPAFGFTATESASTFTCRVDAGTWAACTSPWTTAALADGGHSVSVRARDAAGNTDASPATRSFTVDTAAPHTTITSQPAALSLSGSGSVGFTVDESASASQCRLDNGAWSACSSPYEVSGLGVGQHQVDVRSSDGAGNVESPGASATWTVVLPVTPAAVAAPAVGPTVTLTAPAGDATMGRTARFAANATSGSPISRVEFWVDSNRAASDRRIPYVATVDLTSVHSGMHTVTARAFDSTGQAASTAVLVRVSRTSGGRVRAAAVSSGGRATKLTSEAAGAGATQLAGQGPSRRMLAVTLTRCADRNGKVVDRARMRADAHGQLSATRARAGLCVLSLSRPS